MDKCRSRSEGFGDPAALIFIIALCLLVYVLMPSSASTAPQAPKPMPGASIAFAPYVFIDQTTGCQYLSTHTSTGLAPRIAADGKTHMGCKEAH